MRGTALRVFAFAMALLAATELVARIVIGMPMISVTHPQIEYMFSPNQHGRRFFNRYDINEYGMRSPSIGAKQGVRVLVIGDSVVNGGHLTDQSELATSRLPWETLNVSAGSWGPPNQLAYVKQFGTFASDIVVLVLSSHDAFDVPSFAPLNPRTHPTRRPYSVALEALLRYGLFRGGDQTTPTQEGDALPALAELLELTHPVVLLHPTRDQPEQGLDLLRGFLVGRGIEPIGLEYPADAYSDDIHLTASGQEVLGRAIERGVRERIGEIPQRGALPFPAQSNREHRDHPTGS